MLTCAAGAHGALTAGGRNCYVDGQAVLDVPRVLTQVFEVELDAVVADLGARPRVRRLRVPGAVHRQLRARPAHRQRTIAPLALHL